MASNGTGGGTRRAPALADLKGKIVFVSQKRCGRHVDETAERGARICMKMGTVRVRGTSMRDGAIVPTLVCKQHKNTTSNQYIYEEGFWYYEETQAEGQ